MDWCNPEVWSDEKDFGLKDIEAFANHFSVPLGAAGYDKMKVMREWKRVRAFVQQNLLRRPPSQVWKNILLHKRQEFPNFCLLLEIVFCLSGSNSSVERAFSILTSMLTDRRLKSSHNLLEMRLCVKINDKNWSEKEKEEILERALEIYMNKRRKLRLDDSASANTSFYEGNDEIILSSDTESES